ncbi:MAG: SRPBCC family protein [Gammaproteobacteria bacterium]|nr:SRPBCC family protein [Gammaproteobacteria bacterium]MDH3768649.1 SRPBCC family protein [Gammaproteobacteria bacterium]
MAKVSLSRRIECPRHEVFRLFCDVDRLPSHIGAIKGVEKLTEGPVGVGTRFRETREMFGKQATEEMVFTDFLADETYTVECDSHGTRYRSIFQFEPVGDKTDVNVRFEVKPLSLAAKLLSPLGWLMIGATKKLLAGDVEDLKKIAESGHAA